jgi:hypothetical protein
MKMHEVWTKQIGRFEYYILLSPVTARWMLCRRHEDPRDDDMVATGYAHRAVIDDVISEVRDELLELCKEITHD